MDLQLPDQKNPHAKGRSEGQKCHRLRYLDGFLAYVGPLLKLALHNFQRRRPCEGEKDDLGTALSKWTCPLPKRLSYMPRTKCEVQTSQKGDAPTGRHTFAGHNSKYILVGTYTWLLPQEQRPPVPDDEFADSDAVVFEEEVEENEEIREEKEDDEEEPMEEPGEAKEAEEERVESEEREDPNLITFRLAIPMASKDQKTVLSTTQQTNIQLRVMGYHVSRLHTDLGGEFRGRSLTQWCRSRDIHRTTTAGVSSQSNGRAERAIQTIKSHIRRVLGMAGLPANRWPQACHYVHERERRRMADLDLADVPPFGHELLVKRRFWKTKELEATHEKVRYLAPRPDAHGHLVLREDGLELLPSCPTSSPRPRNRSLAKLHGWRSRRQRKKPKVPMKFGGGFVGRWA